MDPSRLNRWSSRLLLDEAATLAFMREGPADIRPALLLLFHAQDVTQFAGIHRHGYWYLRVACTRLGEYARDDVLDFAAGDALAVMWRRRAPASIAARARLLRVRNATYSELRAMAIEMYQTRLHEARVRFAAGTICTPGTAYWKSGTHPTSAPRTAPGNVQRNPAQGSRIGESRTGRTTGAQQAHLQQRPAKPSSIRTWLDRTTAQTP